MAKGDRAIALLRKVAERTRQKNGVTEQDETFAADVSILLFEEEDDTLNIEGFEDSPEGFAKFCESMADILVRWQKESES